MLESGLPDRTKNRDCSRAPRDESEKNALQREHLERLIRQVQLGCVQAIELLTQFELKRGQGKLYGERFKLGRCYTVT